MPPVNKAAFSALMAPDIHEVYIDEGRERPLEYPLWANVTDMPWNPIKDQQTVGIGFMPDKPEGTRFQTTEPLIGNSIEHTANPRGWAIEFTWEGWDDELYGVHFDSARGLRRSSNNRLETDAHSVLNNAFGSATGFDSVALCSTAHTTIGPAAGNIANRPSPDVGFSQTYIQGAILRFHNMTNEQGLPSLLHPSMHIINPEDIFTAREILGSSGAPYTSDNEINSLIQEDLRWMVSHYLNTSTYHFMLASKGQHDLQFGVRNAPMFDSFDDPWTKNAVFTVYQRNTIGYHNSWRGIDGSTG